jgi:hypothetical protein
MNIGNSLKSIYSKYTSSGDNGVVGSTGTFGSLDSSLILLNVLFYSFKRKNESKMYKNLAILIFSFSLKGIVTIYSCDDSISVLVSDTEQPEPK